MKTIEIRVTGTHCASCSMLIEMTLDEMSGVHEVACDHASGLTKVTFDETAVDVAQLLSAIEAAGYGASVAA